MLNRKIERIIQFLDEHFKDIDSLSNKGLPKRVIKDLKKDVINFMFRKFIDNFSKIKKVLTN